MTNNKKKTPRICFVKWKNPFTVEEEKEDNDDVAVDDEYNDKSTLYSEEEDIKAIALQNNLPKVIITPIGVVPLTEHGKIEKVFNLWSFHTNFPISAQVVKTIEETEGVETLDVYTRYRGRVGVGKLFGSKETIERINQNVALLFKEDE